MVPARPAWFSSYTIAEFFATALLLGPLFVRVTGVDVSWVAWAASAGGAAQLTVQALKFLWLSRSETFELRASSLLLAGRFRRAFLVRLAVLIGAGILTPLLAASTLPIAIAFTLALSGEWLGRWLFFVTVVPKNMAAAFSSREAA
jgi:DMSO reductase anchor subunit